MDMNEYVVNNVINNVVYNVQILCKNAYGVSELSNEESVIPSINGSFKNVSNIKLSEYEDSIESFYKNNYDINESNNVVFDLNRQVSLFEREIVLNDLKDILSDKLIGKKNINQYNIRVF